MSNLSVLSNALKSIQTKFARDLNYETIKTETNKITTLQPLIIRIIAPPANDPTQPITVENLQVASNNPNDGVPGSMKFNPASGQLEFSQGSGFIEISPVKQDVNEPNKLVAPREQMTIGDPTQDTPDAEDAETNMKLIATKRIGMRIKSKNAMDMLLESTGDGDVSFKINNNKKSISLKNKDGNIEIRDDSFARVSLRVKTKKSILDTSDKDEIQMDNISSLNGGGINIDGVNITDKLMSFGTDDGTNIKLKDDGSNSFTFGTSSNAIDYGVPSTSDSHLFKVNNVEKIRVRNVCTEITNTLCVENIQEIVVGCGVNIENVLVQNGQVQIISPTEANNAATKGYADALALGLNWQVNVLDRDLVQPPITSSSGDRYLIFNTGINAWAGQTDNVATFNGIAFVFTTPTLNDALFIEDEGISIVYNGTEWVQFSGIVNHNAAINIQGGCSGEFYHLTEEEHTALTANIAQLEQLQNDGNPTFDTVSINALNASNATAGVSIEDILVRNNNISDVGILTSTSVKTDSIVESTSDSGVSIEGVTFKDGSLTDAVNVFATALRANSLTEGTVNSGVTIDGVLVKDGRVEVNFPPLKLNHLVTKAYVDNLAVGLDWIAAVISDVLSQPPNNPLVGDRYIVAAGATLAWFNHGTEIAEWDGSVWQFTIPGNNSAVFVNNPGIFKVFNTVEWVTFSSIMDHNFLEGLQGGVDDEYFHLTESQHTNLTSLENQLPNLGVTGTPTFVGVRANIINEKTLNRGVTIENVLLKDGDMTVDDITVDIITEKNFDQGVTIEQALLKDNNLTVTGIDTDAIAEKTTDAGVTIDGVLCKDGEITADEINADVINEKTIGAGVLINGTLFTTGNSANLTTLSAGNITISGNSIVSNNTDGDVDISANGTGEVNITGDTIINDDASIGGTCQISDTLTCTKLTDFGLVVSGNAKISGDLLIGGTTTTINSTTVTLDDNLMVVNSGPSGSRDGGYLVQRFQDDNDAGTGDVVDDALEETDTLPDQSGLTSTQVELAASANATDNYYNCWFIKMTAGLNTDNVRMIIDYNGTTKIATLSSAWTTQNPLLGDSYNLYSNTFIASFYDESADEWVFGATNADPGTDPVTIHNLIPVRVQNVIVEGFITANTINEFTAATGVTIDGVLVKDGYICPGNGVRTDSITEKTIGNGVVIENITIEGLKLTTTGNNNLTINAPISQNVVFSIDDVTEATISDEGINMVSGNDYKIASVSVLNSTTLGTGVTNSSLTSFGTITDITIDNLTLDGSKVTTIGANNLLLNAPTSQNVVFTINDVTEATVSASGVNLASGNTYRVNSVTAINSSAQVAVAAQPNITSLGTLTTLTVDNVNVNGTTMTTTGANNLSLNAPTSQSILMNINSITEATLNSTAFNLAAGNTYQINGASVLNATTLGTGITASSLTSVGTLTALSVNDAPTFERAVGFTGAAGNTLALQLTTSGNMADDFGPSMQFHIEDVSAVPNLIGTVDVTRAGADNSGKMEFNTYLAGTPTTTLTLDSTGADIASGNSYQIAGTSVLNATTLGSAVVSSSLTSVGTLTNLAIVGLSQNSIERSTGSTSSDLTVFALQATSTGNMVDTFGPQLQFVIEDTALVANTIATISGVRAGADNSGKLNFATFETGVNTIRMSIDAGVVVGAPTGGDKGVGTLNAVGVYDDNVLLTDFVFEDDYEQKTINEMEEFYTEHKHLPTISGRDEWEQNGKFSLGQLANQLWETIEVQAKYIVELKGEIDAIKQHLNL
jgi:hypothetical protein